MAVTTTLNSITLEGDGIVTIFDYDFNIPTAAEANVFLFSKTTGVLTGPLDSALYTIVGMGLDSGTRTVTYPLTGSPLTANDTITIQRQVAYTQDLNITNQDGFDPDVVESQLDRIVWQIQQNRESLGRALKVPVGAEASGTDFASFTADTVFGVGSDGKTVTMYPLSSVVTEDRTVIQLPTAADIVTTAFITAATQVVQVFGYATVGDGGEGFYEKVGSEPTHIGKKQNSALSLWFELKLSGNVTTAEAWGGSVQAAIQAAIDYLTSVGGGKITLNPGTTYTIPTGTTQGIHIKEGVILEAYGAILSGTTGTGAVVKIGGSANNFRGGMRGGTILQGGTTALIGLLLGDNCREAHVDHVLVDGDFGTAQIQLRANTGEICYFNNLSNIYTRQAGVTGDCVQLMGFFHATPSLNGYVNRNQIHANVNDGNRAFYCGDNASTNRFFPTSQNAQSGITDGSGTGAANFNRWIDPLIEAVAGQQLTVGSNAVGSLTVGGNIPYKGNAVTNNGSGTTIYSNFGDDTSSPASMKMWEGEVTLAKNVDKRIGVFSGIAANRMWSVLTWGAINIADNASTGLQIRVVERDGNVVVGTDISFETNAVTRTDISFTAPDTIDTVAGDLSIFAPGDKLVITGTAGQNGTYTIDTKSTLQVTLVEQTITNEAAGASMTLTGSGEIKSVAAAFGNFNKGDDFTVVGSASNDGSYTVQDDTAPTTTVLRIVETTLVTEAAGASVTLTGPLNEFSAANEVYDRGPQPIAEVNIGSDTGMRDIWIKNTNAATITLLYHIMLNIGGG